MSEKFRTARVAVVSVALTLVAAGGVTYAAEQLPKNSVTSKTIKNGSVKAADLKAGAVTSDKIADSAKAQIVQSAAPYFVPAGDIKRIDVDVSGCEYDTAGCQGGRILDFGATGLQYHCGTTVGGDDYLQVFYSEGDENVLSSGLVVDSDTGASTVRATGEGYVLNISQGFKHASVQVTVNGPGFGGSAWFNGSVELVDGKAHCTLDGTAVLQ